MDNIINLLKSSTSDLEIKIIQVLILKTKKEDSTNTISIWNEITQLLWQHLQNGFNKFDDQLLCATCFYTTLSLTDRKEYYLDEILKTINAELCLRTNGKENGVTPQVISLMYGLYQSTFLIQKESKSICNLHLVLQSIFKLLVIMAYEYSKFTFIVFKILSSFQRVCGSEIQNLLFTAENQIKLLNLINHNWENPLTGVRDLNKIIFRTLLSVMDQDMYDTLVEEINGFYWNKAKYLMLAEIINTNQVITEMDKTDWINGLIYSLHKPGLVSAGADMYYAMLKQIKSEEEWCTLFSQDIINLLKGTSIKAIENFNNYWCSATFKAYPLLANTLIMNLKNDSSSENSLYSCLFIMKHATKLGLLSQNSTLPVDYLHVEKIIITGLENCKSHVRMLAFDIVCISLKSLPTKMECELIINFLQNNVNSDCTVLRINMLNSFSSLMAQIHVYLLNKTICQQEHFQEFCKNIQELIIRCLNMNGNYQRKITSIKLAKIFLQGLNEIPRKKQKQTKHSKVTIIEILKDKVHWVLLEDKFVIKLLDLLNDPADDVRESVIELLLCHYIVQLQNPHLTNHLTENALIKIKSKYFYEINCGRSMFQLITNLLLMQIHIEQFQNVEDILQFAYNELYLEFKLNRNIVESIENGKQLHSFITILHVVLEVCYQKPYKVKITNLLELVNVLEEISNQFSWNEESSTSSDFSKISDMVEKIIIQSGCKSNNDQTKISGMHQIVLNCLWLNVKASCDLLSLIIQYQREDIGSDICEKCLGIIIHVLETCRHKGAIEAAGIALGKGIRHLTSMPDNFIISKIPFSMLKCKLDELISEANKMASVTRRGAGLSIMVHRIVSNDSKQGKPLFHYFINTLLKACSNTTDKKYEEVNANENDLPKAIYIHFLTRIVTDSNLASDMMYYSAKLAELAFGNLTSPQWQIRNAALQLYGALIPKLIGQKKVSGTDEETIATVACDELRTHSPKLWEYIQIQLKSNHHTDKLQRDSNLVPILNMIANSAKRYNFKYDVLQQKKADAELLQSLLTLLQSTIYTVRRLTAKCISNIYMFDEIYSILMNQDLGSENLLHGKLMLMLNYYKVHNNMGKDHFNSLGLKYSKILKSGQHSYLCKVLLEEMFNNNELHMDYLKHLLIEVNNSIHAPGIFLWAYKCFQNYVKNISWNEMPEIIKAILGCNDFENYCDIILQKIKQDINISTEVLLEIVDILMAFQKKFTSGVIWKILYEISLKTHFNKPVDVGHCVKYLEENGVSYKLRYLIPFLVKLFRYQENQNGLTNISKIIYSLTDSETMDVDMRYIAALANNELGIEFSKLSSSTKIVSIISAVILLEDEDEDVRNLSVQFYKNVNVMSGPPHPYICLSKLLDYQFLTTILNHNEMNILYTDLLELLSNSCNSHNGDEYNPFTNDSKNIYLEIEVLKQLVENIKKF